MTPKVSIIVPSYNHGPFLRAGLAGVQAQTMTDWELILIDDGSRDDSVAIAREVAASDDRIQVHVNETNLGTYGTQERARLMARSEHIAVLNSDDLWEPTKLEKQLAAIGDLPVCYTLGWKIDENGKIDTSEDVHADWPMQSPQELIPYLLYENRVLASSVLFRADSLRFEKRLRYSGDWWALLHCATDGPVALVPERLNYWRMHSHNTFVRSANQVHEEVKVRYAIAVEEWNRARARVGEAAVNRGTGMNWLNLAALQILRGERKAAIQAARIALSQLPDKKIALRRLLSVMLPNARQRLWPGDKTVFTQPYPDISDLDF